MMNDPNNINNENLTTFYGGQSGDWKVLSIQTLKGNPLESIEHISVISNGQSAKSNEYKWSLKGLSSNLRYTNRNEKNQLDKSPSVLGKKENKYAALIPIKKNESWWLMTQDERRSIFEEQSKHIHYSLQYLNIISRKLYHSKDIGEPFDFLTWFEFAPENSDKFDELLKYLRQTKEWSFVEREIDIRLVLNYYS